MSFERKGLGEHIQQSFDRELESVRSRVLSMGGLVERQITDALTALRENNSELAEYVIRTDHRVNAQEVGIDEDCTYILARRQPTARDLRMVTAIIKTITDLERIGDESEKIANAAIAASTSTAAGLDRLVKQIDEMGQDVLGSLRQSLDAFVRNDTEAALRAAVKDTAIDQRYVKLISDITVCIKQNPDDTEIYHSMMWVARALERIGDHSKNICEYVIYLVRGKDVRHISIDELEQELGG
jgi:phosphate transport system protein